MLIDHSTVLICPDEKLASREAAERFVCAAVRSVAIRGVFTAAVSGGNTPKGMYKILSRDEYSDLVPWAQTELFFADERCVPPESEQSNYRSVRELLLSTVPIPETNVHRAHGEDSPEEAANKYDKEIHEVLDDNPSFDLIILGMGADTHTASLFPHSSAIHEVGRHAVANYIEKLDAYRLTLTYPVIRQAETVIVQAYGDEKASAVREALLGPIDVDSHPVQGVCPTHGRLIWILDRASASHLIADK